MTVHIELKPCPFCGGEARVDNSNHHAYAFCANCGAGTSSVYAGDGGWLASIQKAAEAWNQRVGADE